MDSMADALSRSCPMLWRVKVCVLFKVEKLLSDSDLVVGVVMMVLSRVTVSAEVNSKLFS